MEYSRQRERALVIGQALEVPAHIAVALTLVEYRTLGTFLHFCSTLSHITHVGLWDRVA
jgi:hypothetical protein